MGDRICTLRSSFRHIAVVLAAGLFHQFTLAQEGPVSAARNYQMTLWRTSDVTHVDTAAYTDLAWFSLDYDIQPARRAVLRIDGYYQEPEGVLEAALDSKNIDWSRIAAVWVDEPYWGALQDPTNPCTVSKGDWRYTVALDMSAKVKRAAEIVRQRSPATRFWVNFSAHEMNWVKSQWALSDRCSLKFNDWYIDVISLDQYEGFESVRHYYDWLLLSTTNRATPYQQIALIPQVFHLDSPSKPTPAAVALDLQQFFDFAQFTNRTCNYPIGRVGRTGSADQCPLWIVAGFAGVDYSWTEGGQTYVGMFVESASPIKSAWRAERNLQRRDQLGRVISLSGLLSQ
jgi:hypothetical protein